MGIKGLYNFIVKHVRDPSMFAPKPISLLRHKRVVIDSLIYAYKFNNFNTGSLALYWTQFLLTLLAYDIRPVFIFDSVDIPVNKKATVEMRHLKKNKQVETIYQLRDEMRRYALLPKSDPQPLPVELLDIEQACTGRLVNVNSATMSVDEMEKYFARKISQLKGIKREDMHTLHQLCQVFGVEYYIAPGESDRLCAYMFHEYKIDYVMSNDSDMLAYRCNVIKEFNIFNGTFIEFNFTDIIQHLHITAKLFTDLCVLSGTDYTHPVGTIQRMYNALTRDKLSINSICQNAYMEEDDVDVLLQVRERWMDFDEFTNGIDEYRSVGCFNFDTLVSFIQLHVDASLVQDEYVPLRKLVYRVT
jgi:hypothetical protein